MRCVAKHMDMIRDLSIVATQPTPAFINQCTHPGLLRRVKDHIRKRIRIIDHDGAKPNINRHIPRLEEIREFLRRLEIIRHLQEHETRDINLRTPVVRFRY